ncbi:MAG: hypothetical protein AAB421_00895 [Patescibacteria group bacterium]
MTSVIGLIGEKGGGKGTFAIHLASAISPRTLKVVRFSTLLRETLDMWHLSPTRANLQKIAVVMDDAFGVGTLANATYERVAQVTADVVLLDGVRWDSDLALVRRFPKNALVYITASPEVRYARTVTRGEKVGESETSFEQFMREEQAANEVHIARLAESADQVIKNDGDIDSFARAVETYARGLPL